MPRKAYEKHTKINISGMAVKEIREYLGISDIPGIKLDTDTNYSKGTKKVVVKFSPKLYENYRGRGRKDNMVFQNADKDGNFDITKFKVKLAKLIAAKDADEKAHKLLIQENKAKLERQESIHKGMQEIKLLNPDGYHITENDRIKLLLDVANVQQVKRVMGFVNSDPEMGVERIQRALKESK